MSYVFYDTETTGTNTFFDQILQFAAVRTDEEFNELERFEIRCRLLPHIIPSPIALNITGITIESLLDKNLPSHYEMVGTIKDKLEEWSPSIFVGWNSIGFDEELLRQAFYQNLYSPYLTNTQNNCRTDALPIVMSASHYQDSNIKVPKGSNGKTNFKLDQIAPANGFLNHNAHDAMGDVEATIHMCKLVDDNVPDCWSNAIRFSQKNAAVSFINDELIYMYTASYFGKTYTYPVTTLRQNSEISTQYYVFDLSVDPIILNEMNDEELSRRLSSSPKPIRKIKVNASPILNLEDESPELIRSRFPDNVILEERANYLKNNQSLVSKLISFYEVSKKDYPISEYVEEQIYTSFTDGHDLARADIFHQKDWEDCFDVIDTFSDDRLKSLAIRLIYNECPEGLNADLKKEIDIDVAKRQLGIGHDSPKWNTLPDAIKEVDNLINTTDSTKLSQLNEVRSFLMDKQKNAQSILK